MRRLPTERRPSRDAARRIAATAGIVALLLLSTAANVQAQVDAPTQYAPSGWIGTPNPTYTWSTVAGAITHYHLYVESVVGGVPSLYYQIYYTPGEVCSGSTCSATPPNPLPLGHYQWWVRARSTSGWGHWSWYLGFDVWGPPSPTLHSPTGPITTPTPIYTWNAVGGAVTQYQIWIEALVEGVWTFKHQFFYTPAEACSGGTCSAMPTATLGFGYYRWQMRSRNASGWGDWGAHLGFDVGPLPAPAPLSPTGSAIGLTPTFSWSPVSGVVEYYVLSVHQGDGSGPPLYTPIWYSPAQACSGGTCSATPTTALALGSPHAWKVWARNAAGPGYPSAPLGFVPLPTNWQTGCAGALLIADFSGDGRTDRLCSAGVTYVSVATPTGFAAGTPWLVQQFARPYMGDFDRDGKPDVADLDSATGQFKVARSTGTAFTSPAPWGGATACQGASKAGTGDLDADGRTDVYCKAAGNGLIYVGRSTGTSFSFSLFADLTCDTGGERVGVADFDGDGLGDWYCGGSSGAFSAWLGSGTTFTSGSFTGLDPSFCSQQNLVLADLNADGATDAFCPANGKVALSTGRALVEQGAWGGFCLGSDTVFPADLDGDRLPELVCNNPGVPANDIEVRRWTGAALGPVQTWRSSWCGGALTAGDFDGDSRMDVLCGDSDAAVAGTSGVLADLMRTAQNGLGGITTVSYRPSSDFANTNNPPVKHVVTSLQAEDGRGRSSTTTYTYAGGKFDREERRSLGFASMRAILPRLVATEPASPYTDTTFSQDLPSAGRPLSMKRYNGASVLLAKTDYTYTDNATVPRTSLLTAQHDYQYDSVGGIRHTHSTYAYDAYGNQTQVLAGGDFNTADDNLQTDMTYSYNTSAYIVSRVAQVERRAPGGPALTKERYEYDSSGNWQTPPVKGDLTALKRWLTPPGRWVTRQFTYKPFGALESVTDETNRTTTTTYDAANLFLQTVTNGAGESETTHWHAQCGQPIDVTDANGQVTTSTYDELCRSKLTTNPLGSYVEQFYLDLGNPNTQRIRTEAPAAPGVSGRDWTETYFDGLGRTYQNRKRGPSASQDIVTETTYNVRGGVNSTTEPFYDGETPRTTSYEYDPLDRVTRQILPGGAHVVEMIYAANSQTTTDPNGKPVTTRFDGFGRTIEVKRTLSGSPVVTYTRYDPLGQQSEVEDALGNTWTWMRDSLGRMLTENDPDRGTWSYTYDDAGRMTLQTDAKGQQTTFNYDPQVGRLTQRTSPVGAVTFAYGEPLAGYFNVGRLTTISLPRTALRLDHDALGRPILMKRTLGGTDYYAQKTYDSVSGFLLATMYPDGDWVGPLGYDEAGRLKSIAGIVNSVLYDASGRPTELTNANSTVTTWSYTPDRGFLERIRTTFSGTEIQNLGYDPDPMGLVQQVTSPLTSEGWTYDYDDLYRLTSATNATYPAGSQTLQYDEIGRITYNSRAGGAYTYPAVGQPRPHAPLTVNGGPTFVYDANGNLTSGEGRTPVWDAENRITQLGTTNFTYDAFGERLAKATGPSVSVYPFGDDFEITNDVVTKYVSVEGLGVIAKRIGYGTGATTYWLHTDHLGSIQSVTDADSWDLWRSYRPYGETLAQNSSHVESRGWIDQRNDAETGLTYLHARYFDPKLGTFLSPDPIGPAGGLNAYGYGFGNPVNLSDRGGLGPDDDAPGLPWWLPPWIIPPIWDWLFGDDDKGGQRPPSDCPFIDCNRPPAPIIPTPQPIDIQIIVLNPPGPTGPDHPDPQLFVAPGETVRNPPPVAFPAEASGWIVGVGILGASCLPGAGEVMDFATIADPTAAAGDRALSCLSLGASALSAGLLPNFGATRFALRATTGFIDDVTVIHHGRVVGRGTVDVRATVEAVESGKLNPRAIFENREGLLPKEAPGYYQEFVHPTPGVRGAGPQRIVRGRGGKLYYTPDHYKTFVPLN